MNIQKPNIIGIMVDRLPDNCVYDCKLCYERPIYDDEAPFCIVVDEFVNEFRRNTHPECPLFVHDEDFHDAQEN
jgi:hypothetical protein